MGDDESYQYAVYTYTTLNGVIETKTKAVSKVQLSYDMMQLSRSVSFAYGQTENR